MVTVGEMDVLITIRRWASVKGPAGGLNEVNTNAWQLWSKAENKTGKTITDNGQMTWSSNFLFTCYYETDRVIANQDTVDYDGQRFLISNLSKQTEGNRQMLVISTSTTGTAITDNLSTALQTVNFTGEGTTINVPEVIGKVPKLAFTDGVQFIIVSGTPNVNEKEVQIDSSTGNTTWSQYISGAQKSTIAYSDV